MVPSKISIWYSDLADAVGDATFVRLFENFADALNRRDRRALITCFEPGSEVANLLRVFGVCMIQALLGLKETNNRLVDLACVPQGNDAALQLAFRDGRLSSCVLTRSSGDNWRITEIYPFNPLEKENLGAAIERYRQLLASPPAKGADSGLPWADWILNRVIRANQSHGLLDLTTELAATLDFLLHLSNEGFLPQPWYCERTYNRLFQTQYKATETMTIVKWLKHSDPRMVRRFRREIDILAAVQHLQGTPQLLKHGLFQGRPYHICRLAEGLLLCNHSAQFNAMPLQRQQRIAAHLIEILQRLHGEGIIHRDVAPDHILIAPDDRVCMIDFGMSEHVASLQPDVLLRCIQNDLGNLGLTLHELFVGTVSFAYGDPDRLHKQWATAANQLWESGLPIHLKTLITRLTQSNKDIAIQSFHNFLGYTSIHDVNINCV